MAPKKTRKSDSKAKDGSSKGDKATGGSSKLKPATEISTRHILVSLAHRGVSPYIVKTSNTKRP